MQAISLRFTGARRSQCAAEAQHGVFDDPDRMQRFAALFAQRFIAAYQARRAGRPTTASWKLAFDVAGRPRPVVLQHLLLGMSAHINLDLGVAVAELSRDLDAGDPTAGLQALRSDFLSINRVLSGQLNASQECVNRVSPFIAVADAAGLRSDEELCRFVLRVARDGAWQSAEQLSASPPSGLVSMIDRRDQAVAAFGRHIVHPGGILGFSLFPVRIGELRSIRAVIDALSTAPRTGPD